MKKALWTSVGVLFLVIGVPSARADTYIYAFAGSTDFSGTNFTLTISGPAQINTAYCPDPLAGHFYEFGVDNGPLTQILFFSYANLTVLQLSTASTTQNVSAFQLSDLSQTGSYATIQNQHFGTLTIATAEPGSFSLMLVGVGLVGMLLAMRKRLGLGLRRAN